MMYRCSTTSVSGFFQQLAVCYVGRGYWFYVTGQIPEHKDPLAIDRKLIAHYGIDLSKYQRHRRKREQKANRQYLRYQRFFALLATPGQHAFFEEEKTLIRDIRKSPLLFAGHAISYKQNHPHVRIAKDAYQELRAYLLNIAYHHPRETLEKILLTAPYEAYAPVQKQLLSIAAAVNQARKKARLAPIATVMLKHRERRVCQPFAALVDKSISEPIVAEQTEIETVQEPVKEALQSVADPLLAQFGSLHRHLPDIK
ncbi:MAG: hypothetical protein PHC51_04525 [bacterium]|nr:hypothetical protein [bacterium]